MEELLDQYKACAKELVELRKNYDACSISEEETNKMYELNRAMGPMENILRIDLDRKFSGFEDKVFKIARKIF